MKKHILAAWFLGAVCSLTVSSCQNRPTLQKPIESITHDEASGFTLITDTVKIDMSQLNVPFEELSHDCIVKQRGQYKLYLCLQDSLRKYFFITTTLNKDLAPLYDTASNPLFDELEIHDFYVDPYQNEAIIISYDSIDYHSEKRLGYIYKNLDTNEEKFHERGNRSFHYQDDYIQAEYIDVGEFGHYQKFYSKDRARHTCFYMPLNRLLRWHGHYYGIASSHIFKIEDPLADGPTRKLDNEARYATQDTTCQFAFSIPDLELRQTPMSNSYMGNCEEDTVYTSGFIHNDNLYIVESRPNDGFYLMQLDEKDRKSEVLRICDFKFTSDRTKPIYLNLQPPSYAFFYWTYPDGGFMEIQSDTIRMVHLQFEGLKQ